MKFSYVYALVALPLLAAATPGGGGAGPTKTVTVTATPTATSASQCSTGQLQCCQSTQDANNPATVASLALLGIVLEGVDALVGLGCSPITVVGVANPTCNAKAVCCEDNSQGNGVSVGCVPIIL